jgi:wyosine [tRNA(Phe)-imidazoG37] synthetase (radical SAM superfamily)
MRSLVSIDARNKYIDLMRSLNPDEIQLNTPTRPKPSQHLLETRGNFSPSDSFPLGDRAKTFHRVSNEIIQAFANEIYQATGICVRFPVTICGKSVCVVLQPLTR